MIPYGKHFIDDDDIAKVVSVLKDGPLTQGPKIEEFEKKIALKVGAKFAVAVSSATAALHLACVAARIDHGDEVLIPPNTFVSTANAAVYCGARPVFVDIDYCTLNMSPEELAKVLQRKPRARAIIPVHFGGLPCDMQKISTLAKPKNLIVIEDASHALGATYSCGRAVGSCSYSDFTVFSLHPVKGVTAGEGGVITTNNFGHYKSLMRLRSHGICKGNFIQPGIGRPDTDPLYFPERAFATNGRLNPWYYEMQELGFNYRLTDFQAALATSQLDKLEKFIQFRQNLALKYDEALKDLAFIEPAQKRCDRRRSSLHLYVVRIDFKKLGIDRANFMKLLGEDGVGSQVHYIPVHWHPYYAGLGYDAKDCSVALNYYETALTLPLFFNLSEGEFDIIIRSVKKALSRNNSQI